MAHERRPEGLFAMDELEDRRVYIIRSRNLSVGAWRAETKGFIGVRLKFGSEYLFEEYHYDADPHVGTVSAATPTDVVVPNDMLLAPNLPGSWCKLHDRRARWVPNEELGRFGKWYHMDDGSLLADDDMPRGKSNHDLFDLLKPLHDQEIAKWQAEREVERARMESEQYRPQTYEEFLQETRTKVANTWLREQRAKGLSWGEIDAGYRARLRGEIT